MFSFVFYTFFISDRAIGRLAMERTLWKYDYAFGFVAKPCKRPDRSLNFMRWDCAIPGKTGTPWEGGHYKLKLRFPPNYPISHPSCRFDPPVFHVNVYSNGSVCLPLLEKDWIPTFTVKDILHTIQDLLDEPNPRDTVNNEAYLIFISDPAEYTRRIRDQAQAMALYD